MLPIQQAHSSRH